MSKFKKLAMFFSFIFVFCISAVLAGCEIGLHLYESEYFIYIQSVTTATMPEFWD